MDAREYDRQILEHSILKLEAMQNCIGRISKTDLRKLKRYWKHFKQVHETAVYFSNHYIDTSWTSICTGDVTQSDSESNQKQNRDILSVSIAIMQMIQNVYLTGKSQNHEELRNAYIEALQQAENTTEMICTGNTVASAQQDYIYLSSILIAINLHYKNSVE